MLKKDFDDFSKEIPEMHDNVCDKIYAKHQSKVNKENTFLKFITRKAFAIPCLIVFLLCIFTTGIYATVEAKEYQEAVEFFEDNELSLEGLSRAEIKKVYKDITTNTFKYELTGEVILNSIKTKVPGYEIEHNKPTVEENKTLWEYWDSYYEELNKGIHYEYEKIYDNKGTSNRVDDEFLHTNFYKYDGDDIIWTIKLNFDYSNHILMNNYILIYGGKEVYDYNDVNRTFIITLIDIDGKVLWDNEFMNIGREDGIKILNNQDNTYTFVTFDNYNDKLRFYEFNNNDCRKILEANLDVNSSVNISSIINFQDGYLVSIKDTYNDIELFGSKIIKINKEGNVIEEFLYKTDNNEVYIIQDMIEYNNKVYISAYSVNELVNDDDVYWGTSSEISSLLNYFHSLGSQALELTVEEMTSIIQNHYKAMLLVCDDNNIIPIEFYEVKASLGNKLKINDDNELVWNVHYINYAIHSPYTSSFSIGGDLMVYEYIFDENGKLINQINTFEKEVFRR